MQNKDVHFMRIALEIARAEKDEMPIGAVVVTKGKVVGKSSGNIFANDYLNHAEMIALNDCTRKYEGTSKMSDTSIYTTLEPCIMCFGTILHCRVARVIYALEDPYGGAVCIAKSHLPQRHKKTLPKIIEGLYREESRLILKEFFTHTKDPYWKNNLKNPLVRLCLK